MTLREVLGFPVEDIRLFCGSLPPGDPEAARVCRIAGLADEHGWDASIDDYEGL